MYSSLFYLIVFFIGGGPFSSPQKTTKTKYQSQAVAVNDVTIKVFNGEVVIFTIENSQPTYYILQTTSYIGNLKDRSLLNAQVIYSPEHLIVHAPPSTILFGLNSDSEWLAKNHIIATETHIGYGLAKHVGIDIQTSALNSNLSFYDAVQASSGGSGVGCSDGLCQAGGPGSDNCTLTVGDESCTVNCKTGYSCCYKFTSASGEHPFCKCCL